MPDPRLTIVASPHFAVRPEQLRRLATAHPRVDVRFVSTPDEYAAVLPDVDAAITGFGVTVEQLAHAPRLRWLQAQSAGVDRLLTPELRRSSLLITASKGPMGVLMAEHVVALLFALARNLPGFFRDQREHSWRRFAPERPPLRELSGKTILVLGVGSVGQEIARICKVGLQMRVLGFARSRQECPYVDRFIPRADLHQALGEADVVTLSLPTTPETTRIIDAAALTAMKPGAFLINVGRGQLVDEAALVEALRSGHLGGAGLDAFEVEPLPAESPLWSLPNVIVTPHTSAITDHLGDRFVDFWSGNVRRFAEGEPLLGVVDKMAGY